MNFKEIRKSADLSNKAYRNQLNMMQEKLIDNKLTDAQIHVGVEGNNVYIVGRGTTNKKDVLHDLQFSRSKCKYINNELIHTGFLKQYDSVRDEIHETLKEYCNNSIKRIICCGHSLGASLCTIAALDIKLNTNYPVEILCITFASPRVGSKSFAKCFNKQILKSYRFVYHRDPVTFLPLCLRFSHVKGCIHFKKSGKVVTSEKYFYPFGCLISQHNMDLYKITSEKWIESLKE